MKGCRRKQTLPKRNITATVHDLGVTLIIHQTPRTDRKASATLPTRKALEEMHWRMLSTILASKTNDHMLGRTNDLSSHLLINHPYNGQFSATLDLNNLIEEPKKEIFLHVCRKRIDIFYKKKETALGLPTNNSIENCDLNLNDNLILEGHLYLPMFIDTDAYEFSLDDSGRFYTCITAAIQGAISLCPSPIDASRKGKLIKSLSYCREYLNKKFLRRSRVKSDSDVIPSGKQPTGKKSGNDIEVTEILGARIGSWKSFPTLIEGSTTVKGIFKPFQLLKEVSKRGFKPSSCRWTI